MRKFSVILLFLALCSPLLRAEEVRYLTTEEFKRLIVDYTVDSVWHYKGDVPCVIDFYATWCGPCKRLAPIMEELAEDYCEEVIFYKVDTDKERELAYIFGIRSIPSILLIPVNGRPQMIQGLMPKQTLEQAIFQVLKKKNPRSVEAANPETKQDCTKQGCSGACGAKQGCSKQVSK